jgi:hypothetical protein
MKCIGVINTVAVFLFVGTMIPAYAQHDGHDGDKQDRQDTQDDRQGRNRGRSDRAQARPDRGGPPREEHAGRPEQQPQRQEHERQPQQAQRQEQPRQQFRPQRTQEQARAWQQQRGWVQPGGWQGHDTWQQNRAKHWASDHRSWAQRGGYGGYYVPQDRFNLYFGSQHYFRLRSRPVIYMGYPRFEYSGFSFLMVDPFPEYWSESWYGSDDVYIDYDDGYYLHNRGYPQVRLAITLAL